MAGPTMAEQAYARVARRAADSSMWRNYRTIAMKLPVMVHNEGLTSALHFVAARRDAAQKSILDDLAADLAESENKPGTKGEHLLDRARKAGPEELRQLQRDVLRRLLWYKRMVQAFGREPTKEVRDAARS